MDPLTTTLTNPEGRAVRVTWVPKEVIGYDPGAQCRRHPGMATTDLRTLPAWVAGRLGMDEGAAADALNTYIDQMEELDGRTIDPDKISEEDADFLLGSCVSAQRAGDFGERELAEVEELAAELDQAEQTVKEIRQRRNAALRRALASGARVMLWERSPAPMIWTDEGEDIPTTCDGVVWGTHDGMLTLHLLTRLAAHRNRLSPLRSHSPVVPATSLHIPVDHPHGAGTEVELHSLTTPEATEAGVAALAAVGARWLLMTQETAVEDVETTITRKARKDRPATVTRPVVAISERRLRRRRYRQEDGGRDTQDGGGG